MIYDKWITCEVILNCTEQGLEDYMIESYVEMHMHELNSHKSPTNK